MPALGKAGPHGIPNLHLACFPRYAGRRCVLVRRDRLERPWDVLASDAGDAAVRPAGMTVRGG